MGQLNPLPQNYPCQTHPHNYLTQLKIEQDLGCRQIIENALLGMDI
jgi:hypothetical protein